MSFWFSGLARRKKGKNGKSVVMKITMDFAHILVLLVAVICSANAYSSKYRYLYQYYVLFIIGLSHRKNRANTNKTTVTQLKSPPNLLSHILFFLSIFSFFFIQKHTHTNTTHTCIHTCTNTHTRLHALNMYTYRIFV